MLKKFLALVAAFVALSGFSCPAAAETWPNRPLKFTIGFPPGGLNDVLARLYGEQVGKAIGQPVVLDYKPGASGRLAMALTARAKPDGYTLALGNTGALTILPHLYSDLRYDPQHDFTFVSALGMTPLVMVVRKEAGARSVKELLEESRKRPMSYGTLGIGSPGHLAFELLKEQDNFPMISVPYKGTNEQIPAVLSGQVDVALELLPSVLPFLQDGRLRALAVTSAQRVPQLADTPTLTELGYDGMVVNSWYLVLAPAGTPKPIVDRLALEYRKASETQSVYEYMQTQGLMPFPGSPSEIGAALEQESERWQRLIKARNIRID